MTTYPLPTLAATITASGITAPSYQDIFESLKASYRGIFGSDVDLDEDTQDGQFLGILALAISDSNQTAIAVYNQFSPATSQGVGLSSVVKINGIRRHIPSNSQASVEVIGQAFRVITNGLIGDSENQGTIWSLPSVVTIPDTGSIVVQATCTLPGAIIAPAGTLTVILTPTPGWQEVNNAADAAIGAPVESDADLRRRQSRSTALPAQTVLDGIYAAVASVTDVQRLTIIENDSNITDFRGIPSHSIAVVVEGGDPMEIATAIALKKAPGTGTYGDVSEVVVDEHFIPVLIRFFVLTTVKVKYLLYITGFGGFQSTTETTIREAMAFFSNNLAIGESVYKSRAFAPAGLSGDAATLSSGLDQQALDQLGVTYNVTDLAITRTGMQVISGPYGVGVTTINVNSAGVGNIDIGDVIYFMLDGNAPWKVIVTNKVGTAVTFAPAIPISGNASTGSYVYISGDAAIAFNEAAFTITPDDIQIQINA